MAFGIDDAALAAVGKAAFKQGASEFVEIGAECAERLVDVSESNLAQEFRIDALYPQPQGNNAFEKVSPESSFENDASIIDVSDQIEKEFAPEAFQNIPQAEVVDSNINAQPEVEIIERTSTFEDQTVDNFKLEEQRSEIGNKFNLGQPHDADTLRGNMEAVMEKQTDKSVSRAHHIVGNETPNAAKKLEQFGIDRNDPANGILLPNDASSPLKGSIHSGRHLQSSCNTVEQRMAQASTREEALEVLQSLKEDLYSGDLPLQRDVQPNK